MNTRTERTFDLSRRHVFVDDAIMAEAEALDFAIHTPRADGVVLAAEREWEAYRVMPISVIDDGGVFKMWYSAVAGYAGVSHDVACPRCSASNRGSKVVCVACGWPLIDIDVLQNEMCSVCYAESTDGVRWERPNLGLVAFRGSRQNNLIAGPCGVPALNPKGSADERFMGIVEHERQLYVTVSADGLCWRRKSKPFLPFCADTTNQLIYDAQSDRYVAFLRGYPNRRVVVRCESESLDASPWAYEERGHAADATGCRYITDELPIVLDVDEDDPALAGLDINHLSACRYAEDVWLAFPSLYRKYPPAGMDGAGRAGHRFFAQGNDGTWQTQLAVSRDGRRWMRADRASYLGPDVFGEIGGGLNSIAAGIIRHGQTLSQFAFAQNVTHGIFSPGELKGVSAIVRYTQPIDRFIAASAGAKGGRFLTQPICVTGSTVELNIDCGGLGEASVEIRDEANRPIDGFTHADCDRVDLNHLTHRVCWRQNSDVSALRGRTVRFDVRMQCGRLYAMAIV